MSLTIQSHKSSGRATTPRGKRSPYRTRSYSSNVDETLFGNPARYNDQKDTPRIYPEDVNWDPPWVTTPKKSGAPLFWTPVSPNDAKNINSARKSPKPTSTRSPSTPKNKYRPKKRVPSYVDETLFGTPKKSYVLQTPWAMHGDEISSPTEPSQAPANFSLRSPQSTSEVENSGTPLSKPMEKQMSGEANSMHYTPVIKPRAGSTLNTPHSQKRNRPVRKENRPATPTSRQNLDFCIENGANSARSDEHDPDAIVERALKLAGISRNSSQCKHRSNSIDGLSSKAPTPGRYFWRTTASPTSSTRMSVTPRLGPMSSNSEVHKTELQIDDLFSASGTRMPLSARGTVARPESARTANSDDSVPGLDLSRPSKICGVRTPRSARSVKSAQSSIMNRPSWRP